MAAIYTGWQGQLAVIGPGGFEVGNGLKFGIGGQVMIKVVGTGSNLRVLRSLIDLVQSGRRILT